MSKTMNATIAFLILAVAHLVNSADLKDLNELKKICQKEENFSGSLKDVKSEGASKESKCYVKCLMEKKEVLKKDGSIDKAIAKAYIEVMPEVPPNMKPIFLKALDECSAEVKLDTKDMCEYAYKFLLCKRSKMAGAKN